VSEDNKNKLIPPSHKALHSLSPGDIIGEVIRGEIVAHFIVVGRSIENKPFKNYTYMKFDAYILWVHPRIETDRLRVGLNWTFDDYDLWFEEGWEILFKSPLSWKD
jgi:vacuolar-type H+-ATPase catalytic subunit A/Vma1